MCVQRHNVEDLSRLLPVGIEVVLDQKETGPCAVWDMEHTACYILNHFEYEPTSLDAEYKRDKKKGTPDGSLIPIPRNYYPDDNEIAPPLHLWKENGIIFFNNWLKQVCDQRKTR